MVGAEDTGACVWQRGGRSRGQMLDEVHLSLEFTAEASIFHRASVYGDANQCAKIKELSYLID